MKRLTIVLILIASLFILSCKPSKGQIKKDFITSCIAEAKKSVAASDGKTTKALEDYCNCAGEKVIDAFTIEELEKLNKNPADPMLVEKLKPIVTGCEEALGRQLGE